MGIFFSVTHVTNPLILLLILVTARILVVSNWRNALLFLGSLVFSILLLEVALRMNPEILGYVFANKVLSKYRTGCDGIFVHDHELNMNFMKPNFQTTAYWNGYRWHHQTDSRGFRNRLNRKKADIVLLGDSLIYGHGVDLEQTVGHFLEEISGLSVANLARQGDCPFQEAYVLDRFGLSFSPRYVFCSFCDNDLRDLETYLSEEEMRQYIQTPIEEIDYPPRSTQLSENGHQQGQVSCLLEKGLYCTKIPRLVRRILLRSIITSEENKQLARSFQKLMFRSERTSLEWEYTRKAIERMDYGAKSINAQFVLVPITPLNPQHSEILEDFANSRSIPIIDTRCITERDDYVLPNDGHLSGQGALALATLIAEFITDSSPLASPPFSNGQAF